MSFNRVPDICFIIAQKQLTWKTLAIMVQELHKDLSTKRLRSNNVLSASEGNGKWGQVVIVIHKLSGPDLKQTRFHRRVDPVLCDISGEDITKMLHSAVKANPQQNCDMYGNVVSTGVLAVCMSDDSSRSWSHMAAALNVSSALKSLTKSLPWELTFFFQVKRQL